MPTPWVLPGGKGGWTSLSGHRGAALGFSGVSPRAFPGEAVTSIPRQGKRWGLGRGVRSCALWTLHLTSVVSSVLLGSQVACVPL